MIMTLTSAVRFCIPLHILCNSDISGTCYGMCTMCWLVTCSHATVMTHLYVFEIKNKNKKVVTIMTAVNWMPRLHKQI